MRNYLRRHGPIGVDLGSKQVKAVQLARDGAGWRVHACAAFPRLAPRKPFDRAEAARLSEVLDRQGFVGRDVVAGIAPADLMTSMLELPPRAPGVPLEQIARLELARVHQRDPNGFEFSQWEVPPPARASKATHAMTVACAHDRATSVLDVLEEQELRVRALDAEQCALARACRPLVAGSDAMAAVLDLGWSAARLAIIHRGVIVYSRAVDEAALEILYGSLGDEMEIDPTSVGHFLEEGLFLGKDTSAAGEGRERCDVPSKAARGVVTAHFEALVKEVNVAFSYASHQYSETSVQNILLAGGGADLPGVAEHLGGVLGVPAHAVKPTALVGAADVNGNGSAGAREPSDRAAMTAALGMALYYETTNA